jgi:hypothetical protein
MSVQGGDDPACAGVGATMDMMTGRAKAPGAYLSINVLRLTRLAPVARGKGPLRR